MGFWHTGYIEFHEPLDLEGLGERLGPPMHQCPDCEEAFEASEALYQHRFESHPALRPRMFIRGRQVGTHPHRITLPLRDTDCAVEGCDEVVINETRYSPDALGDVLSNFKEPTCRIELRAHGVPAFACLRFAIAEADDLVAVESGFRTLVDSRILSTRKVTDFMMDMKVHRTALDYVDGIGWYLQGVVEKESAATSGRVSGSYETLYNKSAAALLSYERPLGYLITSLIDFHFNSFRAAALNAVSARVGITAMRYLGLIEGSGDRVLAPEEVHVSRNGFDGVIEEQDTEQLMRWILASDVDPRSLAPSLETFCISGSTANYDVAKARLLLGQIYVDSGNIAGVRRCAGALRNLEPFSRWAARVSEKES